MTSIATRTRSSRPSRRFDLLEGQWERRRFEEHRRRVRSAERRVDNARPASADYRHVQEKLKKRQKEAERFSDIMMGNLILLRHLSEISMTKRVDDGRSADAKKVHWKDYYGTILLMRQQQVS